MDELCNSIYDVEDIIDDFDDYFSNLLGIAQEIGYVLSKANTTEKNEQANRKSVEDWLSSPFQIWRAYFDRDSLKLKCQQLGGLADGKTQTKNNYRKYLTTFYNKYDNKN